VLHLHVPIFLKSGSLILLEPSEPVQACNGIALPVPLPMLNVSVTDKLCLLNFSHIPWNRYERFVRRCKLNITRNLLKPTGYVMHQKVEHFNNCTLCPHYIYVFCIYLRTNSNLCHLHKKKLTGFYN
jgi:hypothetical protein